MPKRADSVFFLFCAALLPTLFSGHLVFFPFFSVLRRRVFGNCAITGSQVVKIVSLPNLVCHPFFPTVFVFFSLPVMRVKNGINAGLDSDAENLLFLFSGQYFESFLQTLFLDPPAVPFLSLCYFGSFFIQLHESARCFAPYSLTRTPAAVSEVPLDCKFSPLTPRFTSLFGYCTFFLLYSPSPPDTLARVRL